jgi:hypothetical protein
MTQYGGRGKNQIPSGWGAISKGYQSYPNAREHQVVQPPLDFSQDSRLLQYPSTSSQTPNEIVLCLCS